MQQKYLQGGEHLPVQAFKFRIAHLARLHPTDATDPVWHAKMGGYIDLEI